MLNALINSQTVVLIPHFNNLDGLIKSLKSIHHHTSIDVLVIDDGSAENNRSSLVELSKFLNCNVHLRLLSLDKNSGIVAALNYGLDYILKAGTYKYVARIDCGDTCVINRFSVQEDFLNDNLDISLVGSWAKWICDSTKKEIFSYRPPSKNSKIKRRMSIRCNVIHPTVMYRVSTVREFGNYPQNFKNAEDYAYFFKIAKRAKVANIPKYLTNTEYNSNGISVQNKKAQNRSKLKIVMKYGKRNPYLLFGIAYNVALIIAPQQLLHKIKTQFR